MSIKLNVYNQQSELIGEMDLNPKIFNVKANPALVHQAVVAQMANERQVLAHTKGRGEVRGGGRKPWQQKGTGRARHGSIRSPIWRGGGVTFGPTKERNFKQKINQKMKQKALLAVLSDKVANKKLVVLDKLELTEYKTKKFDQIISGLEKEVLKIRQPDGQTIRLPEVKQESKISVNSKQKTNNSLPTQTGKQPVVSGKQTEATEKQKNKKTKHNVLIINDQQDNKIIKSAKNLVGVRLIYLDNINIVDLLKYRDLILTREVVEKLQQRYK